MRKMVKVIVWFVAITVTTLYILTFFDWGRLLVASLIGATTISSEREPYLHLTRQEEDEIANLSLRYGCKVKFYYDDVISRNGELLPAIGSNGSKCHFSFSWKEEQKDKSLCREDTSYLRQFALNLLPELFDKMRYVKDYPTIEFYFSTDDDIHPTINGDICSKYITIKR